MTGTGGPEELAGIEIGDYVLKRKVGEGAFASIFEGVNKYSGVSRAFKIARKRDGRAGLTEMDWWTKALIDMTGLIARAKPDINVLLRKHSRRSNWLASLSIRRQMAYGNAMGPWRFRWSFCKAPPCGSLLRRDRAR
jgi:hypothetical protein